MLEHVVAIQERVLAEDYCIRNWAFNGSISQLLYTTVCFLVLTISKSLMISLGLPSSRFRHAD